mmetsp:Transcript_161808/g.519044  ORF Transcript_161808/g.519044 Transcript_161808/m.519044 type:complete len:200 (-) Transcript_161808:149-748(-)
MLQLPASRCISSASRTWSFPGATRRRSLARRVRCGGWERSRWNWCCWGARPSLSREWPRVWASSGVSPRSGSLLQETLLWPCVMRLSACCRHGPCRHLPIRMQVGLEGLGACGLRRRPRVVLHLCGAGAQTRRPASLHRGVSLRRRGGRSRWHERPWPSWWAFALKLQARSNTLQSGYPQRCVLIAGTFGRHLNVAPLF